MIKRSWRASGNVELGLYLDKEVHEFLSQDWKLGKRLLQKIEIASLRPLLHEARRTVPVRTGNLKKSIGMVRGRSLYSPTVFMGPKKGGRHDGWYGRMVSGGTYQRGPQSGMYAGSDKKRYTEGRGKTGQAPNPFMEIALKAKEEEVNRGFEERLYGLISGKFNVK